MIVTMGGKGAVYADVNGVKGAVPAKNVIVKDTTGAGDAFIGALLSQIANLEQPKSILTDEAMLVDFTKNANKVGALTTTKLGALDSIPSWDEITA